jgi:hypothetical protein
MIPIGRTIRTTIEQICRFLSGDDLSCILRIGEERFSRNTCFELPIGEIFKGIIYLVLKLSVGGIHWSDPKHSHLGGNVISLSQAYRSYSEETETR